MTEETPLSAQSCSTDSQTQENQQQIVNKESKIKDELRIVLLGRAGAGRTSSVRTILGLDKSKPSSTERCQKETGKIDGQNVVVVDTPGLFKPFTSEEKVMEEVKKSISLAEPGPHVFLFVMRVNDAFTSELQETVELIRRTFGKNTMDYTMVLFTYGSRLKQMTVEEYIKKEENVSLKNLIEQCHWRCDALNNKDDRRDQATRLLEKIKVMIKGNEGRYYTPEMLKEAETALKKQQQQQEVENPTGEGASDRKGIHTSALLGTGAGCLMGYLFGGGEMTSAIGAAVGAVVGGVLSTGGAGLVVLIKNCMKK